MKTLPHIERLISCLNQLPGIGRRSAERIAFELTARHDNLLRDLATALQDVARNTIACSQCGGITRPDENPCFFCADSSRDGSVLCVVETEMDVLLIENAGSYSGRYHVLGGKISPMRGEGVDSSRITALRRRIETGTFKEVILALNSDVESDATASMISDLLNGMEISVSRPAMGLPAGSGIAYTDHITLNRAMQNRQLFRSGEKNRNASDMDGTITAGPVARHGVARNSTDLRNRRTPCGATIKPIPPSPITKTIRKGPNKQP